MNSIVVLATLISSLTCKSKFRSEWEYCSTQNAANPGVKAAEASRGRGEIEELCQHVPKGRSKVRPKKDMWMSKNHSNLVRFFVQRAIGLLVHSVKRGWLIYAGFD